MSYRLSSKAAEVKGTLILPLIVNYSMFSRIEGLNRYQAANSPDVPLADLSPSKRDRILHVLTERVLDVLESSRVLVRGRPGSS